MNRSRRRLLLGGGAAIALLPLSYALRVGLGGYKHHEGLRYLNNKEAALIAAVGAVFFPKGTVFADASEKVELAQGVDAYMDTCWAPERAEMHMLFWMTEHILPGLRFHFRKFTQLTYEEQLELFEWLDQSIGTLRLLARAWKIVLSFSFFNDSRVQKQIYGDWCGT